MPLLPRTIDNLHLTFDKMVSYIAYQLSPVKCRKSPGFTLIEFLVVLGLLVLTIGGTLMFLTSILKGSNKAKVTAEAKQNGQIVLDSLERQIRNSIKIEPANAPEQDLIKVTSSDSNEVLYISCFDAKDPDQNGKTGWIGTVKSDVEPITSDQYQSITNKNDISGVDIKDCHFDIVGESDGGTSPQIVTIEFTVNQGENAPSRKDFEANVQFRTTISLRRYNQ